MKSKPLPKQPLADRILDFRQELDRFIDDRAEALKQENPNVPILVLRNILTARSGDCQCQAVCNILGES